MEISKMAIFSAIFLAMALFSAASAASVDSPFIVAHKKVSVSRFAPGVERLAVSVDLYNRGTATAYDVSLTDDSWTPELFNIITGSTSKSWERLDAGSSVSHSFVLECQIKQVFYGAPAVIRFRVPSKAALQEAYSTPILPLDLLADRPPEKKFEWATKWVAKYAPLLTVLSLVGLFIHTVASPSKSSAAKSGKKRR
ncbi:translocon-associated protein subunit beta isoform X1 [Amborella trichopoda]|uniref:translocon-associated protein subunit beta isoform X1 n=1 Tax=Amborella trichopoda TaxID=13333 RepID=UPI0005D306E8|nr:translocon-associated protein subunit beta isoform X1 [Amborella trichopoda]|eukprot:XP_011623422.1 translocon-associated protein subunit beta isoform X1 [Amborella trichopoda]